MSAPLPAKIPHCFAAILLISLAVLFAYGQVVTFDFIHYDDYQYIKGNEAIRGGFSPDAIRWAFTSFYAGNWHPLTWLSHMLDIELFGLNAGGHHLANLLFHLANSLLLLAFFTRTTGALWCSTGVALLFALHPLHVESVAWVAERKDVLGAFFWLLTMLAYSYYRDNPRLLRYFLVLLLFTCGLMAKPMLVTLPFVLLLLDVWPLQRFCPASPLSENHCLPPRRLLLEKLPLILLAAGSSLVTFNAQKVSGFVNPPEWRSVGNALVSYTLYLKKMVWPAHLAIFYPYDSQTITGARVALAATVLILLTLLFLGTWRRFPYLAVGWLWYLGTLVPVIGFVRVGGQALADRYTYLPLIGPFLMVVWGGRAMALNGRFCRRTVAMLAVTAFIALAVTARHQVTHWRNSFTLFSHALETTENNWLAHGDLGAACLEKKKYPEALFHLQESVRYNPDFKTGYNNLGSVYDDLGDPVSSINSYKKALDLDPRYISARQNLVQVYLRWGYHAQADDEYRTLRELSSGGTPEMWEIYPRDGIEGKTMDRYRFEAVIPIEGTGLQKLTFRHSLLPDF